MRRPGSLPELNEAAGRVTAEAGGLLQVDIVRPSDFLDLVTAALGGDADALWLVRTAGDAVSGFSAKPRRRPALCACCPRPLRPGRYAVAIVRGASETAAQGLALGICRHCATDRDDLLTKAREGMARIWPDVRPVSVTHPAGSRA